MKDRSYIYILFMQFWLQLAITVLQLPYAAGEENEDLSPRTQFYDHCLKPGQLETNTCKNIITACAPHRMKDGECKDVNVLMRSTYILTAQEQRWKYAHWADQYQQALVWATTYTKSLFGSKYCGYLSEECRFVARNIMKREMITQTPFGINALFHLYCIGKWLSYGPCLTIIREISRYDLEHLFRNFCPNSTNQWGCEQLIEPCGESGTCNSFNELVDEKNLRTLNSIIYNLAMYNHDALEKEVKSFCMEWRAPDIPMSKEEEEAEERRVYEERKEKKRIEEERRKAEQRREEKRRKAEQRREEERRKAEQRREEEERREAEEDYKSYDEDDYERIRIRHRRDNLREDNKYMTKVCKKIAIVIAEYESLLTITDAIPRLCNEPEPEVSFDRRTICDLIFRLLEKNNKLGASFNFTCERKGIIVGKVYECPWYPGCTVTVSEYNGTFSKECQLYIDQCYSSFEDGCTEINFRRRFSWHVNRAGSSSTSRIETSIYEECGKINQSNPRIEIQCMLTVNLLTLDHLGKLLNENTLCSSKYSPNYNHFCMRIGLRFFQPSEKYPKTEEGSIGYEYFKDFCLAAEKKPFPFGENSSCQTLKKYCDIYTEVMHPLADHPVCHRVKLGYELNEMAEKDIVHTLNEQCTHRIEFNVESGLFNTENLTLECALIAYRIIEALKELEGKELTDKYIELCNFATTTNHAGCVIAHNLAVEWTENMNSNTFFEANCLGTLAAPPAHCQLFGTLCSRNLRHAREKSKLLPQKMAACGRIERLFMLANSNLTDLTNDTVMNSIKFHSEIMCSQEGEEEGTCAKYINKMLKNAKEDVLSAMLIICSEEKLNSSPVGACGELFKGLYISGEIGPALYWSTCTLGMNTSSSSSLECKHHHSFCQEHNSTDTCLDVINNEKLLKLNELVTASDEDSLYSAGQLVIEECDSKKVSKKSSCDELFNYLTGKEEILAKFVDNRVCFTKEDKPNDACPKLTELSFDKYPTILQKTSDNCPISDEEKAGYQTCKILNGYCSGHKVETCFKRRHEQCTTVIDLDYCKSTATIFCDGSSQKKCEKFYGSFMNNSVLRTHIDNECLKEDSDLCRAFVKINAVESDSVFAQKVFVAQCYNTTNRLVCKDIATLCKEQDTLVLCSKTKKRFCVVLDAVHCVGALTHLCENGANTDCTESVNAGMRDLNSSAYIMEKLCNNVTDTYRDACTNIFDTALLKQHLIHGFESMCRSYEMSNGCVEVLKFCEQYSNQQCVEVRYHVEKLEAIDSDLCTTLDDRCMTQLKKLCEELPDETSCNHMFKRMDQSSFAQLYGQCVEGKMSSTLCELQKQKMTEHNHTAHVFSQLCGGGEFLSKPCKALRDICKEPSANCETVLGIYNNIRNLCIGVVVIGIIMAIAGGMIIKYTKGQRKLELEQKKAKQRQSSDSILISSPL